MVVPYYPVVNDMVLVKGDDDDPWRAQVTSYNLRQQVITGQFFIQRPEGMWIPENSRPQNIAFKSILATSSGNWINEYNLWQEM